MYAHWRRIETGNDVINRAQLRQLLHHTETTIGRLALKAAFQWPA